MSTQFIGEINGARKFFEARGDVSNNSALQKSLSDTLICMIKGAKNLSPADASAIFSALKDQPYGVIHTKRVTDIIDGKLENAPKDTACSTKQKLKHWWAYMTPSEFASLKDPKMSWTRKVAMAIDRGLAVGCMDPDEQTLKWLLATLLLVHYDELPSTQIIYGKLQDLKHAYAAEKKVFDHEQLVDFPTDPTELPDHIFADAYAVERPDHAMTLQGVNTVAELIPLRRNSKLLKKSGISSAVQDAFTNMKKDLAPSSSAVPSSPALIKVEQPVVQHQNAFGLQHDPTDNDELKLFMDYQRSLLTLRASKSHPARSSADAGGVLKIDGEFKIATKLEATPDETTAPTKPKLDAKQEESTDEESMPENPAENDLDEYTKAAIASLKHRSTTKATRKRPAAASPAPVKVKKQKVKVKKQKPAEEPPVKAKKWGKVASPKMPSLPKDGTNPAAVHYKGGVIYTSRKARSFRALTIRHDKYSEKNRSWGSDKPSGSAWKAAVCAIDEHYA